MRYDLAALAKGARNRRIKMIAIREVLLPSMLAANLYAAVYNPVLKAWASRLPAILAQYDRSVAIRDGFRDSAEDVQQALDAAADYVSRLILTLTPVIRDWVVEVETAHRSRWRGAVLSASGVDLETLLMAGGEPTPMQDVLSWNTSLVRDVSDQVRQRIGSAVFAGLNSRAPVRDVAKQIDEAVGLGRKRSKLIAQDQLSKMTAALDTERMADAGIEQFRYRHSGKLHPRSTHRARDGKLYDLAKFKEVGGTDEIVAGDRPGQPPYCGCRKAAMLVLD